MNKKHYFFFIALLTFVFMAQGNAACGPDSDEPERTDLYNTSKGDGVVPPYRIPGICTASNGRLITVAARLVCGTDPGYGQVDVVCRTSDDNGTTWSDIRDVAVGTGRTSATENYFDTAFGDPAVVADRDSREVIVMAVAGCTVYGNGNTTRQNPNMIAVIRSTDNGGTWQEPVDVTEQIYSLFDSGNPMQAAFVGGGKVFQSRIVKKDRYYRLYAALCARPNGNRVIYSDDFGRTWQALGGAYALPAAGGDEPKCEEMPDGRVILSSRVAGGRIYNIYTYENTMEGTGDWGNEVKSTFSGAGLTPGNNSTNGEILVLPVVRNSDGAEMYLALQSLPTGSSRTDVGIFYKELSAPGDMSGVAGFATGWDGFRRISTTSSAYSSMDLQADGKVGFIYEETLTGFGKRNNPVSTSFPTGAGQHNFDGFDNIYLAMSVEYITNAAYSLKRDADRGAFLRRYFAGVVEKTELSAPTREAVMAAVQALGENPATEEVDRIYALLTSEKPADPWDGKTVTLTNVQQDGTEYVLYLNDSKELSVSSVTAEGRGSAAEFLCTKQKNGKYSFYNGAKQTYMIWRAGKNNGYNNNKGTLDTYNATFCDWDVKDGGTSIEGTYYLVSKRSNGTTDGSLIIMRTGVFDGWSNGIGLSTNYSNLFRIDVKDIPDAIAGLHGNSSALAGFYDLTGRKVGRPDRGIYVSGGRKVLVR
ncbi:MAG: glycoside hydrolase [Bacteroidaceae bacterium]|nr:glycoside hydrolase [Bacteroidaceae bacterium]